MRTIALTFSRSSSTLVKVLPMTRRLVAHATTCTNRSLSKPFHTIGAQESLWTANLICTLHGQVTSLLSEIQQLVD